MAHVSRPIRGKGTVRRGWRTEQTPAKVKVSWVTPGGSARPASDNQHQDSDYRSGDRGMNR